MRGVEEAGLLEPTDRAPARVGREHATAEARLMEPDARLAHGVPALERCVDRYRIALVDAGPTMRPGETSTRRATGSSAMT